MLLVAALFAVAGCSSERNDASSGSRSDTPSPNTSSPDPAAPGGAPSKLLVVVLENHSAHGAAVGMPGLAAAAARYGLATASFGLTHPSLPNYLAIAAGSTFGVRDDHVPAAHPLPGPSVFGQVLAAGKVAKTYAEGMIDNCQVRSSGRYAAKHNPWAYFTSPTERAGCLRYDVPAGTPTDGMLHDDIAAGTLPTFGLLIPDMCNDAHDCSLATADRWLQSWLGTLLTGQDFRSGRLAIVITFDEDDHKANNNILTAVLHPELHGRTVTVRLDHNALSHAVSHLVGAQPLRDAAAAPDLLAAFGLAKPG
jgi:acid phosphatase